MVIANAIGRKDGKDVERAVYTSVLAAFIGGLLVTLLGELFIKNLLSMLHVPEDVFPYALLYIRIYLLGMPVIFLYNFEAAIFRSVGDTKIPLRALAFSGVLNVILNLFFVICLKWIHLNIKSLKIDRKCLLKILGIGFPAGIQSAVFNLANVVIQSAINSLGTVVIAASSAAYNIEILVYYVFNSFSQACTTFVGQNYGAGQIKRCKRTLLLCLIEDSRRLSLVISLISVPSTIIFPLFTS